ncbi:TolB family protein [Pyxidicoccus caerfyrddinensis]|uniref:TolB family protein n=1 Tax=Pyxidicoccus caerfyrddinensis TaxID=2709663 RepID=UPI0013D9DB02|nr:PD40 domain-containing protein [Pyxidicoccus caerfyrddinensis]
MSTVASLALLASLSTAPTAPRIFAADVVSTAHEEFGAAFSPDGNTVYFNRADPTRYTFQLIMVSHFRGGRWTKPEVAPFSGRWRDIDPALSPDGRRLFFASNRPVKEGEPVRKDFDVWMVEREGSGWSTPRHVPEVSTDDTETNTSVTANGTLYLTRMPSSPGGKRAIHRYPWKDGHYGPGEKLPAPINTEHGAGNHFIAPDERYLLFSSEARPGSLGTYDLWVSFREGTNWSTPRNLGAAVNLGDVLTPVVVPARGVLVYASRLPFQVESRATPYTTEEFDARLRAPGNGQGDLYEVALSAVGLAADTAASR